MKELEIIKKTIYDVAKKFNIEIDKVILFGSRARGDYKEHSDWDILIITKEKLDKKILKEFLVNVHRKLVKSLKSPIDVIIVDREYYEKYKGVYGDIAGIATLEGKVI